MSKKYAALHLGDYLDEELSKAKSMTERIQSKQIHSLFCIILYISVCEKRLASGWFTYSLIEIKQRYRIPGVFCFYNFNFNFRGLVLVL